jgi:hypothetical protein
MGSTDRGAPVVQAASRSMDRRTGTRRVMMVSLSAF